MDEEVFLGNEMAQDAVIRNIEIIGEASHNIEDHYPEFATAHPELPLAFAYQMRNAVAHGYFKVDLEIVWKTIQSDLPGLHRQVETLSRDLSQDVDQPVTQRPRTRVHPQGKKSGSDAGAHT